MKRVIQEGKNVYHFAVSDTAAAWTRVEAFMRAHGYEPHEQTAGVYYRLHPSVGAQYLQFFKSPEGIQVCSFLGGLRQPLSLQQAGEAGIRAEEDLQDLLHSLAEMEETARTEDGFMQGAAPVGQPSALGEDAATTAADTAPETRTLPAGYAGYQYDYDPVNGGAKDRASNAVAGLVIGVVGAVLGFLLASIDLGMLIILGVLPAICGLICSVNGLRSEKKALAMGGIVLNIVVLLFVVFAFCSLNYIF